MNDRNQFPDLYSHLAKTWDQHQALRRSDASIAELAMSSARVHRARRAMAAWHRTYRETVS